MLTSPTNAAASQGMGTLVLVGRTTMVLVGIGVALGCSTCTVAVAITAPGVDVEFPPTGVIMASRVCAASVLARLGEPELLAVGRLQADNTRAKTKIPKTNNF